MAPKLRYYMGTVGDAVSAASLRASKAPPSGVIVRHKLRGEAKPHILTQAEALAILREHKRDTVNGPTPISSPAKAQERFRAHIVGVLAKCDDETPIAEFLPPPDMRPAWCSCGKLIPAALTVAKYKAHADTCPKRAEVWQALKAQNPDSLWLYSPEGREARTRAAWRAVKPDRAHAIALRDNRQKDAPDSLTEAERWALREQLDEMRQEARRMNRPYYINAGDYSEEHS
jgi:hypothetical protein